MHSYIFVHFLNGALCPYVRDKSSFAESRSNSSLGRQASAYLSPRGTLLRQAKLCHTTYPGLRHNKAFGPLSSSLIHLTSFDIEAHCHGRQERRKMLSGPPPDSPGLHRTQFKERSKRITELRPEASDSAARHGPGSGSPTFDALWSQADRARIIASKSGRDLSWRPCAHWHDRGRNR